MSTARAWVSDEPTLWRLIEARAAATPGARLAIDEDGREISFVEYREECERVAAGFHQLGLREGDVVSWQLPTWIESFVLVGALSRLGVVQNPILPIYREREVGFVTRQAGAKLLIVPGQWKGFDFEAMALGIAREADGLEVLVADRALPQDDPDHLPPPPHVPDALRWLFYTSGTTADPKGAKHTDPSVWASAWAMVLAFELDPADRHGLVFPFTHIGGLGLLMAALISGCSHAIVEAFAPATTIPVLRREDVTIAGAGTVFHLAYLDAQRALPGGERLFPNVRAFVGGGAAKPPQLHYDMRSELGGVGIVSGYGLTECPILVMASIHDPDDKLAETEGRATPGVEIKVVKLDGTIAPPGEEGELRVRGPQLCQGYLDASLDADAFDADGFFKTGDLGVVDTDGYVAITGRVKDVIIRKGENISAKEVEDILFTHPKIADVAVVGLPDARRGERACAVVVTAADATPITLEEMGEFGRDAGLMVQKLPEQLELVDVLPRNPTGKVLKHELRARYAES
ncbi:MAG TPA: AMP-binding protein [Acidimicrobiia bacterium]|nr:AMP-binding protein [Acidimicrobiia bacterium]